MKKINLDKNLLYELYIRQKRSLSQIYKLLKCGKTTIYRYLKKYNIPIRSVSEALQGGTKGSFKKGFQSWNKGIPHSNITRKRISLAVSGENHYFYGKKRFEHSEKMRGRNNPNWRGGIGKAPYPFDFNNELKELIRKRDNYKCQVCGCPQIECERKLDIHHKDGNKKNLNPENLISLCRSCHIRIHFNKVKIWLL